MSKGPGQNYRKGITLFELTEMFPDETSARKWFEGLVWKGGRHCPRCGSFRTHEASHKTMPYRCTDCRKYFSVKTGTLAEGSNLSLRKWVFAIYLESTSLKGVSSMKLHRDLGVSQPTAWFMLQRIRTACVENIDHEFAGPVEVDETYVGGRFKNMHGKKRHEARNTLGRKKAIVAGIKDRATNTVTAKVIPYADKDNLHALIKENVAKGAMVYTDEAKAYNGLKGLRTQHRLSQHRRICRRRLPYQRHRAVLERLEAGA